MLRQAPVVGWIVKNDTATLTLWKGGRWLGATCQYDSETHFAGRVANGNSPNAGQYWQYDDGLRIDRPEYESDSEKY